MSKSRRESLSDWRGARTPHYFMVGGHPWPPTPDAARTGKLARDGRRALRSRGARENKSRPTIRRTRRLFIARKFREKTAQAVSPWLAARRAEKLFSTDFV